jgi:hypothetical protein
MKRYLRKWVSETPKREFVTEQSTNEYRDFLTGCNEPCASLQGCGVVVVP